MGNLGYSLCLLANQLKLQLYPFGRKRACASITSELLHANQVWLAVNHNISVTSGE